MTLEYANPIPEANEWERSRDARFRLYRSLLLAVVLLGIGLRAIQYASKTSLWHDEALVTLNLMHRSYAELARPLDYEQAAPPLFLWGEKWILTRFGFGEYQLRFISLVCSVLAVPLFAWVAWRLFPAPVALSAAALFAFCDKLVWHSAEVKQYSGDVFAAVVLLFLIIGWRRPVSFVARALLVGLVAAVLVWFSFPALFVFGGASVVLLGRLARRGPPRAAGEIAAWVVSNLLVLGSFVLLYATTVRGHAAYLDDYWREHFANWHTPWLVPVWALAELYRLFDHPFRSFGWLLLPVGIVGAVHLVRMKRPNVLWACAVPIGLCLIAAMAQKYPFTGERITLFLVPGLFLLFGAGIEAVGGMRRLRPIAAVLPLTLIVAALVQDLTHLVRARSNIREVVQYVREHRQPGEAICLVGEGTSPKAHWTSGRTLELLCYWPDVTGPLYTEMRDLGQIRERRFWIVYAALPQHGSGYMRGLLGQSRLIANEIDHDDIPGGGAYLFEKR
jgi:hypothetical protein